MPPITRETFTWPFQDPDWKNKFLIGTLMILAASVIPLVGWLGYLVAYGYALVIMRTVLRGEALALPGWDNLGDLLIDGLKAALSAMGYLVPAFLLIGCSFLFLFGSIFGGVFAGAISGPNAGRTDGAVFFLPFVAGNLGFTALFMIGMALVYIGSVPTPVAVGQYVRTGQISAGYRLSELWTIVRGNLGGFVIAWVVYLGLQMAVGFISMLLMFTIIFCFIMQFVLAPVAFYAILLWAYLFGTAYREGLAKAGIGTALLSPSTP